MTIQAHDHSRRSRSPAEVPLAMDPKEFRRLGRRLVDRIADHMATLPERRVTPGDSPDRVREALRADRSLPREGSDPDQILANAADLLLDHSLFNGHPSFYGYITASPTPLGMLADLLAAAVNPNVGAWTLSPMATEIEAQTVRWIAELIGYPSEGGGLLVSGGNMANFVGFLAARAAAGASWRIRQTGLGGPGSAPLRVYASAETHTWIDKATDLFGLGTESVRRIPTDDGLRMEVGALRRAVREDREAGFLPFLVVGTAGTVSTGAVDPLPDLARIAREEGLWFHVDGAYGGFAAATPTDVPSDLLALARADSVAVDPHKWLYAPLEAGCILVRDPEVLRSAFSYVPPYYHFGVEANNYLDLGMQNSRGFRALKVWMALQQAGREGYRRMISQDIALAQRLHRRAESHPELEALGQGLSISTFRYVPPELRGRESESRVSEYLNLLNREIQPRMERQGEAFVSNAVLQGRYVLRACVVNFNATTREVDALPDLVVKLGRRVHARADRFAGETTAGWGADRQSGPQAAGA
jgi:aromatic-L-amino-acid/L-tryptophan decarboxylase